MYYVYILVDKNNRMYCGFTGNLKQRVKQHKQKKTWTTRKMKEIRLIFYEAFISKKDAQRREKYFKTTKGKRSLRLMLKEYLSKEKNNHAGMLEW